MAGCCEKLAKALQPILTMYEADVDQVEELSLDFEGPRITVKLKPGWARSLYVDSSPDGVELVAALEAPRGLDQAEAEAVLESLIEEAEWYNSIEEYDIAYDPDRGEAVLTLYARLLQHLPGARELRRLAKQLAEEAS